MGAQAPLGRPEGARQASDRCGALPASPAPAPHTAERGAAAPARLWAQATAQSAAGQRRKEAGSGAGSPPPPHAPAGHLPPHHLLGHFHNHREPPPHTHTRCRSTGEWGRDKKSDPMAPPAGNERATPGHSPAELKKWHLQTPNSEAPSAGTGMMESQDCSHEKISHTPGDSGKQFRELRKKINEQKEVETKKEADKFRS